MPRTPRMPEGDISNFINFDTHKYIKELEASGFLEEQAEVLIKSMLAARQYDNSQLATKEQVANLEKELKKELGKLEKELGKFATHEQLEKLEKKLEKFATLEQLEKKLEKFATKEQFEQLEKKLEKFATREQLQAEIATVKYDILKWIIPMFLGLVGMMVSIFLKLP